MKWKKGILNIILLEDQNYNSNIPSTSTAAPKGKEFTLIAALVCLPPSPNIFEIKSDAPFKTFGWAVKEVVELSPVIVSIVVVVSVAVLVATICCLTS